jgi:hypothetical protein
VVATGDCPARGDGEELVQKNEGGIYTTEIAMQDGLCQQVVIASGMKIVMQGGL